MKIVLILLLGSATVGCCIAPRYNVYMLLASTPIIAVFAGTEARVFGLLPAIAIVLACVTVSQMCYMLTVWLSMADGLLPDEHAHSIRENEQRFVPHDRSDQSGIGAGNIGSCGLRRSLFFVPVRREDRVV
jgi:hypothetical protein